MRVQVIIDVPGASDFQKLATEVRDYFGDFLSTEYGDHTIAVVGEMVGPAD